MNRSKDDILRELNASAAKIGGRVSFDGYGYRLEINSGERFFADTLKGIRNYIKQLTK